MDPIDRPHTPPLSEIPQIPLFDRADQSNSLATTKTAKEIAQDLFPRLTPIEYNVAHKRRELKQELIYTHKHFIPSPPVIIKDRSGNEVEIIKKPSTKPLGVDHIFSLFIRAKMVEVSYFFDDSSYFYSLNDSSHLYSLNDLLSDINDNYLNSAKFEKHHKEAYVAHKEQIEEQIASHPCSNRKNAHKEKINLDSYFDAFPPEIMGLIKTEKDKIGYLLLQELFPTSAFDNKSVNENFMFPPIAFLASYKNFIPTTKLFLFGAYILQLPTTKVDNKQKTRLLQFYLEWSKCSLYRKDKFDPIVQMCFNQLRISCKELQIQEFSRFFDEIQYYFDNRDKPVLSEQEKYYKADDDSINSDRYLRVIAERGANCREFEQYIKGVAKQLKHIAARFINELTPSCMLTEQASPDLTGIADFDRKVATYIRTKYKEFKEIVLRSSESSESSFSSKDSDSSQMSPRSEGDTAASHVTFQAHTLNHHDQAKEILTGSPKETASESYPRQNKEITHFKHFPRPGGNQDTPQIPRVTHTTRPKVLSRTGSTHSKSENRKSDLNRKPSAAFSLPLDSTSRPLTESTSPRLTKKDDVCNHLIFLFISLCYQSFKIGDLSNAVNIYSVLRFTMWDQIEKIRTIKPGDIRKYKAINKDYKAVNIFKNLDELSKYFTIHEHGYNHRVKTAEFLLNNEHFIPHIGTLKNSTLHDLNGIKPFDEKIKFDFEAMAQKSWVIWRANKILESVENFSDRETLNQFSISDIGKKIFEQVPED